MTANMVPVCSITSSMVSSGEVGSRPISFSAMMTWAELDTGSSSAKPWTMERINSCKKLMGTGLGRGKMSRRFYPPDTAGASRNRLQFVHVLLTDRQLRLEHGPERLQGSWVIDRAMCFFRHLFLVPLQARRRLFLQHLGQALHFDGDARFAAGRQVQARS